MTEQLALALTRRRDPSTSRDAAGRVNVGALEALVVEALRSHPAGLTSHQLADMLGRDLVSISPRMRPLVVKGMVREAGRRDGRTIWVAA